MPRLPMTLLAPSRVDVKALTDAQLLELTDYLVWERLAGEEAANAWLTVVLEEGRRRGVAEPLRRQISAIAGEVLAAVFRIRSSSEFRSVPRLRKVLRVIAFHTLRTGEGLKQENLGRVIYRRANFDRAAVAVEVGKVRDTLLEYYNGSGLVDPLRIKIPIGRYVVVVTRMATPAPPDFLEEPIPTPSRVPVTPLNGRVGASAFPAFSADGTQIAFSWSKDPGGYRFDLFVQALGDGPETQITSGGAADISAVWSPDGRWLAFGRVSLWQRTELFIVDPSRPGSEEKLASLYPSRLEVVLGRQLAWAPDGEALAVVDKHAASEPFAIFRFDLSTREKERLTDPPPGTIGDTDPTFSPNGKRLAFVRTEAAGVKEVFVQALGAGAAVPVTKDRKQVWGIAWEHSKSLIISSAREGVPTLWRVRLAGEPIERLPHIGERALYPSCASDGRHLAYTNLTLRSSIWEVGLAGPTVLGNGPRCLVQSARNDVNPDFSPDGQRITFASDRSGAFEIWTADRSGSDARQITSFGSPAGAGSPSWSPDGDSIAFDCRAGGTGHIYVWNAKTQQTMRLTTGRSDNLLPAWSRDGKSVYFCSNRTGRHEIWRVARDGGEAIQVTQDGGFVAQESPDSRFVYFTRNISDGGLWRMPLDGGDATSILPALKSIFWDLWHVTETGIYFLDTEISGPPPCMLRFFDFATGSLSTLVTLPRLKIVHYQGLAVTRAGDAVLYPQLDDSAGEVMIAKLR